ncbi:LysR family transcriptional regulator [Pseudomonas sp. 3A(2025)]
MPASNKVIPGFKSLLAFEATVRLGSMTAAARESGTTQPAISQQVRALEEAVGGALFERGGSSLKPTQDGMRLYQDIAPALATVHNALARTRDALTRNIPRVTIAANFGFTHLWLLPRLGTLQKAFPNLSFEIVAADQRDTPDVHEADINITFDRRSSNTENELILVPEAVFPVCSPAIAREHGLDERLTLENLRALPLLHMDKQNPRWMDWSLWSSLAGLGVLHEHTSFTFNNYPLLINATIQGHGLALAWASLVENAIAEGKLVALGPRVERADHGYLLRTRHRGNSLIWPVVEWFKSAFEPR